MRKIYINIHNKKYISCYSIKWGKFEDHLCQCYQHFGNSQHNFRFSCIEEEVWMIKNIEMIKLLGEDKMINTCVGWFQWADSCFPYSLHKIFDLSYDYFQPSYRKYQFLLSIDCSPCRLLFTSIISIVFFIL